VALTVAAGCALAGSLTDKAFFDGWWSASFLENLWMMANTLVLATIPVTLGLVALGWPRIGGLIHIVIGALLFVLLFLADCGFLPDPNHPNLSVLWVVLLAGLLLAIMGIAYLKGRPRPRWLAITLVVAFPIAVCLIFAVEPVWLISHRIDDGITAARRVRGNGVELVWAPAGPGWPREGSETLEDAEKIVSRLTEDGLSLADSPQNIWRLPTVDEVVRSLTRDGENAAGEWNANLERAKYRVVPDKESPLWQSHSPVVYWWTSSRIPESRTSDKPDGRVAYIVSYQGNVSKLYTFVSSAYAGGWLGFRAVKER
jgi:hypothetical protein